MMLLMNGWVRRQRAVALPTLLWLLLQLPASAADIQVGNGCTLADAIVAANLDLDHEGCSAGSGADRLILDGDVTLATSNNVTDGPNGLPSVTSEVKIRGQGFEISRGSVTPPFRIFHVAASGDLTLENTTLSNGGGASFSYYGGGIYNLGTLKLVRSELVGNATSAGGGGLSNRGDAALLHSTVSDNSAGYSGGGIETSGYQGVSLQGSLVSGNSAAQYGGGASIMNGVLSASETTFADNTAVYTGGGITIEAGAVTLTASTVSGNSTTGTYSSGGGIWSNNATVTLTNSTLSGNQAPRAGAALYLWNDPTPQKAGTITNSTIASNNGGGGALYVYAATAELANTLLWAGTTSNCLLLSGGEVVDAGNNRATDNSCGDIAGGLTGLEPLADNGGLTMTHALQFESNARNAAGDCGLATDQRGAPRFDGLCDSGAFEYGGCPVLHLMDGSIVEAVTYDDCEIEVGPDLSVLGPSGDLTLIAGRQVVLGDGVAVEDGGSLTISLDPQLQVTSAVEARDRMLGYER